MFRLDGCRFQQGCTIKAVRIGWGLAISFLPFSCLVLVVLMRHRHQTNALGSAVVALGILEDSCIVGWPGGETQSYGVKKVLGFCHDWNETVIR